jgi:hypothetical protein
MVEAMVKCLLRTGPIESVVGAGAEAEASGRSTAVRIALVIVSVGLGGLPQSSSAQTMTVPGQFAVGPTGGAAYTIPIAVPPGTAGMVPSLSLSYSSQGVNGLLGKGWTLDGLPIVSRCPRTLAQDGVVGGVNYDANDRFCLEGQRLVVTSGSYGADGAQYRTEIDGYSEVISHGAAGVGPAWFEVHTKSGQVMEFGHTADSQILSQGQTSARVWTLDKMSDSKGNYFTVTYTNDSTNGQYYPIEIDYTGNAAANLSPYNKVQFVYAARPDIIPQYQSGSLLQTTVRLTDVKTFAGTTLVADYKLAYQQSGPSNRSRLTSVAVCEGSGACLPATNVTWTNPAAGFLAPQGWSSFYGSAGGWSDNNIVPRMLVDANGDGLPDIVGFAGGDVVVSLNTGTSFTTPQSWISARYTTSGGWANMQTNPRMLVDVNGDGLPDVLGFAGEEVEVSLNTGTSFVFTPSWSIPFYGAAHGWSDNNIVPRMLVDANGDGLPDIVGFAGGDVVVSLNTGTSFTTPQSWISTRYTTSGGWANMQTNPRMLVDVNGDGLPDVLGFAGQEVEVSLNTGTSFVFAPSWSIPYYSAAGGWGDDNVVPRMLVDVNGDGLPDIVGFAGGDVVVSLNTGASFTAPQTWIHARYTTSGGWSNMQTFPRMLVDVNGDGLPDVLGFAGEGVEVSLNTGTSFVFAPSWSSPFYGAAGGWGDNNVVPRMLVDVNGIGAPGIVGFAGGGVAVSPNVASGPPDLVSSVTTGLAATTTISYAPATNQAVVTKGTGTAFPNFDLNSPFYVVSRVDTSNGVGGNFSTAYTYSGGRIDARGRGFLGFGRTSAKDLQTNIVQTTAYRQDFPYIGLASATTTALGSLMLNLATDSYQFSNASGAASVSTPSSTSAPYRVSVSQGVAQSADLDGTALPTVTSTYQYDAFGNATQVVASTPDGFSKTTANTYTNDSTHWLLGRLTASSVTSVAP